MDNMAEPRTWPAGKQKILDEVSRILDERQRHHGSASIDELGSEGVYWMLRQKMARVNAKRDQDKVYKSDPTDDFLDIIGYAVIELMRLEDSWCLPMDDEG